MNKYIAIILFSLLTLSSFAQTSVPLYGYVSATGTDTYAGDASPAITSYVAGYKFIVNFANSNTGAATININSKGAKSIKKSGAADLIAGDIPANKWTWLIYDGTNFQIDVGTSGGSGIPTGGTTGQVLKKNSNTSGDVSWQTQGGILSGLTTNRIPYATSSTTLGDDGGLVWDATNDAVTVGSAVLHSTGTSNTFLGQQAGNFTLSGSQNTIVGRLSGTSLTSGLGNIAIGISSLNGLTTGTENVAIGRSAMSAAGTTSASGNVAIGSGAGSNTVLNGDRSVFIGYQAGNGNTTGSRNIVIGNDIDSQVAAGSDQLSIQNAIFGTSNAGTGTTISSGNIGLYTVSPTARLHLPSCTATAGTASLKIPSGTNLNTTEAGALENNGTHLYFTFANSGSRFQLDQQTFGITVGTTSITGGTDTRIPFNSGGVYQEDSGLTFDATNDAITLKTVMRLHARGTNNTFVGQGAGNFTLTALENTAIGSSSLSALTSGNSNTAVGYQSLVLNQSGANNIAIGLGSLSADVSGSSNVSVGRNSLTAVTSDNNTAIGHFAGANISSGANNIAIGNQAYPASATASNQMSIQNMIYGTNNSGTTTTISTGEIGIGTNAPLSSFEIAGSFGSAITTVSAATTLDKTHNVILVDATGGSRTMNLPTAASSTRREYVVKKIDSSGNTVVLDGNASETIDGATTQTLTGQYDWFKIKSNGTAWYIIASGTSGEVNSTISTYTNYTTTATYQNVTSITLTAGDWDISAFLTYSSNGATITAASNGIFVISTTTASAAGATEGLNIGYIPQAALLGTSKFSDTIAPYRVSLSGSTTYYLNTQATFTLGNPQYTGSIRARRLR